MIFRLNNNWNNKLEKYTYEDDLRNRIEKQCSMYIITNITNKIVVVVVLLFYVSGTRLRSCPDGKLT